MNAYCEIDEVKESLTDTAWTEDYDTLLAALVEEASRAIDTLTGREPGAYFVDADTVRYFDGTGSVDLWIGELAAAPTSVQVAETGTLSVDSLTTWAATDYLLWPYNALNEGLPYRRLIVDRRNGTKRIWPPYRKAVKITGKFGFSTSVPAEIRRVTIIQTVRWFKRAQQAYADVGAITDVGQLRFVQEMDPDIKAIIRRPPYKRVAL